MPELSYNELKNSIKEKNISNLYLLGGEEYIVDYFEKSIQNTVLEDDFNDFDLTVFSGENLNLDKLSVALETFALKAKKKCVILRNPPIDLWDSCEFEKFTDIISDIPDFSVLIITMYANSAKPKSASKYKKIQKIICEKGVCANFSKKDIPIEKQLIFWSQKDYGKTLAPNLAQKIKNLCENHSLIALKNELKKICEFEKTESITENSFETVVGSNIKTNIFDLPKALASGSAQKTFEIFEKLLNQGEEPIAMVAILSSDYIDMFRTKICINESRDPMDLCKIFDYKKKEFRIKNAARRCKNITLTAITNCLRYLFEADLKLKSMSLSPKLVLSELLIKLLEEK